MKHLYIFIAKFLLIPTLLVSIAFNGFGEGTKQIRPTVGDKGFVQLDPAWGQFALYGCPANTRLQISICNPNEIIYFGFNQTNGDVKFRLKNAAGAIVVAQANVPTAGAGFISTYNQAFNGPSAIVGASGYNALSYVAPTVGDYYLEFLLPAGNPRRDFEYFDITVASPGNVAIPGRVWSRSWQVATRSYVDPFKGIFYIYADDGIVTSLNPNGTMPYTFVLNANQYGCTNTGNFALDRQSRVGNVSFPQYRVFLNNPDVPCFPTGAFGQITQPSTISGCPPTNFCINVFVDKTGQAQVLLELNGVPGYQSGTTDRLLTATINPPSGCIPWDGKDGLGNTVSTSITITTQVDFYNGLTNIPLYDVENNPNGWIVGLVRPAGPAPKLFWDDRLIPIAGGSTNFAGCNSPCHTWNWNGSDNAPTDYGNRNTINTWWYADSTKSLSSNIVPPGIIVDADTRVPNTAGGGNDSTICGNSSSFLLSGQVQNAGGGIWSSTGTGTFTPGGATSTQMNATYNLSAADLASPTGIKLVLTSTGNGACPAIRDTLRLKFQAPPTANAGGPITVCANNPATTLNGLITNAPAGAVWSTSGSGSFSPSTSTLNATYTPSNADTTAGSVTLTLTTKLKVNDHCAVATSTKVITIQDAPAANAGNDRTVCKNSPTTITLGGSVASATSNTWTGGTGTYNPNNTTLNAIYTPSAAELSAGVVNLTLTASRNGCNNVQDLVSFTLNNAPTANAGPDQSICKNNTNITLGGNTTNDTMHVWSGGAGTFNPNANDVNAVYTPTSGEVSSGSLTLTLTAKRTGCTNISDPVTITFTNPPTVVATTSNSTCANNPNLAITGTTFTIATGVTWTGNGGTFVASANVLNPTYQPSAAEVALGISQLIVTTTGNGNCNPAKDTMTVIYQPSPTSNAGPNQTVCANNPNVTLAGTVTNGTPAWSGGGGTYNPNNLVVNPVYTPSATEISNGLATLTLTGSRAGCNPVTSTMTITITPPPTVNAGADQSVCHNNPNVTLNGSMTVATAAQWSGGGGTFTPNNTTLNAVYTPTLAERNLGSVTLRLTTTVQGNCSSVFDDMIITITPAPTSIPGGPYTVCGNKPNVNLNGSVTVATGGTWAGAGTFNPNANTLNAVYTPTAGEISGGSATLTLTTSGNGNCNAVSSNVTISITNPPVANAGPDQTICADNPNATLAGTVTVAGGGSWTGGLGTFNPNNTTLNAIYTPTAAEISTGFVNLTLTTTANGNCNPVNDQVRININPAPTVSAGPDQTVCGSATTVALAGSFTGASGGTWTTSGTGTFSNANSPTATYNTSAADRASPSVTLTFTTTASNFCNSINDQMVINFTAVPRINAGPNQTVCSNDMPVQLNGSGSPAAWTGGAGTFTPNRNTLNATYTATAGEVGSTVTLTLTTIANGACPVVSSSMNITIPPGPVANAGPDQTMCGNLAGFTLSAATITNATGGFWTSSGTGSFTPNASTVNATYVPSALDRTNGSVTLTLTTTGNGFCTGTSDNMVLSIGATISVNAGPDQTFCADAAGFTLNGSVTNAGGGVWSILSGSGSISNVNVLNATYTPSAADKTAGTVSLRLTSTGNNGCAAQTDDVTFTITPAPTIVAGPDQTICADAVNVNLSVTSMTVATGVQWSATGAGPFTPSNSVANPIYTLTAADRTPGTITFTVTTTGNGICNAVTDQVVVTVTAAPTINAGADKTVCADVGSVPLNGTVTVAGGGTWSSTGTGTFTPNANTLNASYNITASDITDGIVTLTLTSSGNGTCNAVSDQMIITITPAPTITAGADRNVCANNPNVTLNGIVTVATGGTWSGGTGTFAPNNNTLNAVYTPSAAEIAAHTATLTITSTGNGTCNAVSDQMVISISDAPTVNAGPDQTICADSMAVNLNATFTVATAGIWTTSGSGTFFPSAATANATYSPSITDRNNHGVNLTFTTTVQGNCNAVSDQMHIAITDAPTVNAGANQTVCANNATVNISGTLTVASGGKWTTSGTGTFANANALATTYTPSALDKAAGTVTLTLTTTGNGTCKSVFDQLTLTIDPAPTVNAGPDQTLCANNATTSLNGAVTIASGGLWTTSGTGTFSPNASTLNATYNPSAADLAGGPITLTLTTTGNGLCNAVTDQMSVSFTPAPTVNAGTDQTICADAIGVTLNGSKTIATGAAWTSSGTGTFSPNAATLNAIYQPSTADTAAHSITLTLTTTGNGTCNSVSDQMTITINPVPIIDAGPDQTICADAEFINLIGTVVNATGGTWTSSGSGSFTPAGSLTTQYSPSPADLTGNSIMLTITSTGHGTCNAVKDQLLITINPVPTASAGADQTVCANNANVTLNGSVTNSTGGTWITSGDGTFNPNANTLNATYTPSANDIAGGMVALTLFTTGNGFCNSASDQMIINITPAPTPNAGPDQSVCANNAVTTLNGSVVGATGGVWSGGTGTFSPNANTLNATYTPTAADTTAGSVTLTLTTTGNGNCNAVTDQVVITITDAPAVNPGAAQTICANGTATLNGSVLGAAGGHWTTASGTGTFTPSANSLNATFTPSALQIGNGRANLTLTTTGNGNCAPVSANLTITIQPVPTANAGNDITICAGTPTIPLGGSVTNATGGTWTITSGGAGTFNPNAFTLNASYQPSVAENVIGNVVTLTLSTTGNGACAPATDQMTITFNTIPVDAGPAQTVCSNSFPVHLNGSGSGSWSGGLGTFADPNALNTTYTPDPSEIGTTVTLTLSTAVGFCTGSDNVAITLMNGPTATAGPDQPKCANNATVTLAGGFTNAGGITWATEGDGSFNAGFTTYTPSVNDIAAGSVKLSVTTFGQNASCVPATDTMIVTFTPAPTVDAGPDQAACSNGGAITLNGTASAGVTTWSKVTANGSFGNAAMLNTTYNVVPADTLAGTITIRLTSTLAGCAAVSNDMNITFGNSPTANAGPDQTICADATGVNLNGSVTVASGGVWSGGTGSFTPNANALNAVYHPTAADTTAGSVTLTLTTTGNGTCNSAFNTMVITITDAPSVNAGPNQTVCTDVTNVNISGTITTATGAHWTTSGSGSFGNANNLNTTYTPSGSDKTAGSVTLTLTTTTGLGSCHAASSSMSIIFAPAPTVNAGLDQSGCNDVTSYNLNAIITNATGGTWTSLGGGTFTPANTLSTSYSPSPADTTAGSVILVFTANTGIGTCNPVPDQVKITFTDGPAVNAGPDQNTCADKASVVLSGTMSGTTQAMWSTSGSGTFSPNKFALNASYFFSAADTAAGTVTLTLTSTDNGTCDSVSNQMVVNIAKKPLVNAGADQTICAGQANATINGVVLNATGGTWTSTGTGTFTPANNPVTVYNPSPADDALGGAILTLTSTGNGASCTAASDFIVINVIPAPSALVNAGFDQTVCRDAISIQLNGFVSNAGGGRWTSPGTGTFFPNDSTLNASYIPSAADKALPNIVLTLTTINNGLCSSVTDNMTVTFTPTPTVNAGGPYPTICADAGGNVTLNGSFTVATGARWTSSGTGIFTPDASTMNATYTPSAADKANGSVGLTLITTGNGTCNAVTQSVTITIRKSPTINAGPDKTVCSTTPSIAIGAAVTNAIGGAWTTSGTGTFSNPNALATIYTPSSADTAAGVILLNVVTTTGIGSCAPVNDQLKITFSDAPIANAGPDQTICATTSVTLINGSVANASGGIWNTLGSGTFSNPTLLNAVYTPSVADRNAGTVSLVLTTRGNAACTADKDTVVLAIQPLPIVNTGSAIVCALSAGAPLNGTFSNATGVMWSSSGTGAFAPNASFANATYYPSAADAALGSVTLTLTSTGNGTCSPVTQSTVLKIDPLPVAKAGQDQYVCRGSSISISAQTSPNVTYNWSNLGGTTISNSPIVTITVNVDSNLVLTVTDQKGCFTRDTVKVSVYDLPTFNLAPNNCLSNNLLINSNPQNLPVVPGVFQWYKNGNIMTGENRSILTATDMGTYTIVFSYGNCSVSASTTVTQPPVLRTMKLLDCENNTAAITITSTPTGVTYNWPTMGQSGLDLSTINITVPIDTTWVPAIVTDALGCSSTDSVFVVGVPVPVLTLDSIKTCAGRIELIDGRPDNIPNLDSYNPVWAWKQNGTALASTNDSLSVNTTGDYSLLLTIGQCIAKDTAHVIFNPVPAANLPDKLKFCRETDKLVILDAGAGLNYTYAWTTNSGIALDSNNTRTVAAKYEGTYKVIVTNTFNCPSADSVFVDDVCPPRVFVPNAFTPDSPGGDQHFIVFGAYFINYKMQVFNRWGEVIFMTTDRNVGWDGMYRGQPMPEGVYPWVVTYEGEDPQMKGPFRMEGAVTVIR